MTAEHWIVDGRVGTAWVVRDEYRTDLLAPRILVHGSIKLALRVAELLNTFGSN